MTNQELAQKSATTIADWLSQTLAEPGQVVETRIIGHGISSGYFDNFEALGRAVQQFQHNGNGIYVTVNPVNAALLARRANRIERMGNREPTTSKADILQRRWLFVDIDPVRPSGISASEEERGAAEALAGRVKSFTTELGWPEPVVLFSGNGYYLLWRIDLPNTDESERLVKAVLESLNARCGDATAKIDTACADANRIARLPGTRNTKGDDLPERPHRWAYVESVPEALETVPEWKLRLVATLATPREHTVAASGDIEGWLEDHGHTWSRKIEGWGRTGDATLYTLDQCPFSDAHKDGAYVVQFADGGVHAACFHDSCQGKTAANMGLAEPQVIFPNGRAGAEPSGKKPKQADLLYLLSRGVLDLFTATDGEAYAFVPVAGHSECRRLRTKEFRNYLSNLYYASEKSIPGAQAIQDVIGILEHDARATRRDVHIRIASHEGKTYIDRGGEEWATIEVDGEGWRVVDRAPVAFKRSKGCGALPMPVVHDDVSLVRRYLNISDED